MFHTRNEHVRRRTWKQIYHPYTNKKKAEEATLISDKENFKQRI